MAYRVDSDDLPTPAGPMMTVLVPRVSPPPSMASSPASPDGATSGANARWCSAVTIRGNTSSPPRRMAKSWNPPR